MNRDRWTIFWQYFTLYITVTESHKRGNKNLNTEWIHSSVKYTYEVDSQTSWEEFKFFIKFINEILIRRGITRKAVFKLYSKLIF